MLRYDRGMYEVFAHTADVGLRIRAADLPGLFADAARGLFSLIVENLDVVQPVHQREFRLAGTEIDYLLFDWLNELLYCFETERLVFRDFQVNLTDAGLEARAWGEPLDPARHHAEHEVKAITYHGLLVEQTAEGWLAEVIVDI